MILRLRRWYCNYFHENAPRRVEFNLFGNEYRQTCRRCGCVHPEFY